MRHVATACAYPSHHCREIQPVSVIWARGRRFLVLAAAGAALCISTGRPIAAEVFVLNSGGRVVGELINRDQSPRRQYLVRTPDGGQVTLEKSQVQRVLYPSAAELEYEKIAPSYPDTVEGQWKLATWCGEHGLHSQRKAVLERIVELDSDNAEARRVLGFHQVQGKWVTTDEELKARGYVRYKGRWKLPQEIEIIKSQEQVDLAEKEWVKKIRMWSAWLNSDKGHAAADNFQAISDPYAVKALAAVLKSDNHPASRVLYIEILAKLGTPAAITALAVTSVEDEVEEVRSTCLDYLKKKKSPDAVAYYVRMLAGKDNRYVNRAAFGLQVMNDRSTIGPLIKALITRHTYKVASGGDPNSMTTTFGTHGTPGSGMSVGGGGPQYIVQDSMNQPVLDALVQVAGGVNFGFDVKAWKNWFATLKQRDIVDGRRGKERAP